MTTITRISSRSASQAESNRRKECVSNAYSEGTSHGVDVNEVDVSASVSGGNGPVSGSVSASTTVGGWGVGSENAYKKASSKCDSNAEASSAFASIGVEQTEIISVGVSPYTAKEQWVQAIRKAPSSMKFVLTNITNLLTQNNVNHIPLDEFNPDGEKLNAPKIRRFLKLTVERYCNITLGYPCSPTKSCSFWNDCPPGFRCVDDSSESGFHCTNEDFYRKGNFFIILLNIFGVNKNSTLVFFYLLSLRYIILEEKEGFKCHLIHQDAPCHPSPELP